MARTVQSLDLTMALPICLECKDNNMKKFDKKQKFALGVVGATVALFLGTWASGWSLAVNSTPSMPKGLYLVTGVDAPKRGDVAAVCIPNVRAANVYR